MAHNISTSTLGIDRFAYNKAGGDPWHKLGQPADGDRSIEEMLALSLTDYEVHKFQIYTQLEDGTFVEAEDHFMTGFEEVVLDTEGFVTTLVRDAQCAMRTPAPWVARGGLRTTQ